ncbi:MAG: TetR/AcrR family transcriptional regulator [Actinomycetota bacterium]
MTEAVSHVRDRLLEAAYEVFACDGVSEGTMGEIARRAGVGRATLYRHFPGKGVLLGALVVREARELAAVLDAELGSDDDDPPALLERGLLAALHHLRSHTLLQRTLREEPESIVPLLTTQGAPVLEIAIEFATPFVERAVKAELIDPVDPRVASEWAARILLSLLLTPSVAVDLDDPEQLRAFVRWLPQAIQKQGGKR